ncbi:hypothetical protein LJC44_02010 [Parabacteroides sp. OttesenSCG-928-G06]|nr:hypothetical protein [Parabacteroides sp. OttesenSCG-928-G06]
MQYTLDFQSLGLTPSDILYEMGYRKVMPEEEILSSVYSIFNKVEIITKPSCTFRIFDGEVKEGIVRLHNQGEMHTGETISGLLKGSTRFALFAATAGKEFQAFQEEIKQEGNMLHIFILDMIGSCIAEKAGDQMELLLEKEIAGYRHTHRFSPGYCGWSLMEQKELFRLLGGAPCGIVLSDVCLMSPIKSISGIIGIGTVVNEKQYGCQFCELETCYKRKDIKKSEKSEKSEKLRS